MNWVNCSGVAVAVAAYAVLIVCVGPLAVLGASVVVGILFGAAWMMCYDREG